MTAKHSGGYSREIEVWDHYLGDKFEGQNFPAGLTNVGYYSKRMCIYEGGPWPKITIFGDKKWGPFLEVGAPSWLGQTNRTSIMWRPGIYFIEGL